MFYTRTGDTGTSSLYQNQNRFKKTDMFYDALGTLDELNTLLGVCVSELSHTRRANEARKELERVQQHLFIIQAEIAGAQKHIERKEVNDMEQAIAQYSEEVVSPQSFVVPGASRNSAWIDYARAVARRTERTVWAIHENRKTMSAHTLQYLNRLSSLLYVLARYLVPKKIKEQKPTYE